MVVRRVNAPRKRPANEVKADFAGVREDVMAASPEPTGIVNAEVQNTQQEFLRNLQAELLDQRSLSSDEIDLLMAHFRQAINEAPLEPHAAQLDAAAWVAQLEQFVSSDLTEGADRAELIRQISQLKESIENKSLQIALEYSERLQRDGEAEAMKWLAAKHEEQVQAQVERQAETLPRESGLRQSVTRSKSRRLRGPPR